MNKLFVAICVLVFLGLLSAQANALTCYNGIDSISVTASCNGTNAACQVCFKRNKFSFLYNFLN